MLHRLRRLPAVATLLLSCLALCQLAQPAAAQLLPASTVHAGQAPTTLPPPSPSFPIIADSQPLPPEIRCPTIRSINCPPGNFHKVSFDPAGCPADACQPCGLTSSHRSECRGLDCPPIASPADFTGQCPAGQYLGEAEDAGCSSLACLPCAPALMGLHYGCRCPPQAAKPPPAAPASSSVDSTTLSAASCPPVPPVRYCPSQSALPASMSEPNLTQRPAVRWPGAPTAHRTPPTGLAAPAPGCTEANKPDCPPGRQPAKQLLRDSSSGLATCHWICEPCPNNTLPVSCPAAGQFRADNPIGHCQPWSCRDCDFKHRDLPACRPSEDCGSQPDWAVACSAGQYRRAAPAAEGGCLQVECASCEMAECKSSLSSRLNSSEAQLPAECRRPCPEPLVLCSPGTTAEFSLDANGCKTATCRPCRDQEACGARPGCSRRGQLDFEAADCQPGLFHLASLRIDGCSAQFCLPCPSAGSRPPGCRDLPAACVASGTALPNCTAGSQQVQQVIDAHGCPSLTCVDCPAERPACPAGYRETPRPTNSSTRIPLDAKGCPVQPWRQSPVEFSSEWLQLDGGCRLRRYRLCPAPVATCRRGELPQLTEGCQYACRQQNWTGTAAACFPGQNYIVFVVDTNRAKSPFQIRFQVASFMARLASQLSYGPAAVQFGAVFYSGRVLSVINPDECPTVDVFFRRLLLLRYDEDSATATGEAVAAAASMLHQVSRPDARRNVEAASLLPTGTNAYFLSLSSTWNPALHSEAVGFVSTPGNLAELSSYYLLGVQLLFPQCYRECNSARSSLAVRQGFLRYLQDSVHQYEAWLYSVYASISQLQQSLETLQYQFESKQI
uniref:VWFA domain-containing protein n=1 Tax=Macrostomum lignano TaxID=282301 RepID=A0A1I8JL82_9PLAT